MKLWLIAFLIFIFAFGFRLVNLGEAGRWSDETGFLVKGITLLEFIKKGDFSNKYWYEEGADHPPLFNYIYGAVSYSDLNEFGKNNKDIINAHKTQEIFMYDLPHSRMLSVVISSLTCVLVFFVGAYFFSVFVGVLAGIILAMIPHFIGYAHFVDAENLIVFLFTACVFSYYLFLEKRKTWLLLLTGILAGLNLETKQSNAIIFPLFLATYVAWKKITGDKKLLWSHLFKISIIAFVVFFLLWPIPWFHLREFSVFTYNLWLKGGLTPDLFFGRPMGAHFYYYFVAIFITTPLFVLLITFLGIKVSVERRKKWIYIALLIWFATPFVMMFFHHRQHMMRYIVQIFAPLSLLAALGIDYLVKRLPKQVFPYYSVPIFLFVYLLGILAAHTPYYLEYYNELVGGTENVYKNKLFFIGWFGEGMKRPGEYIAQNASQGSRIALAIDPGYALDALYRVPGLHYETFDPKKRYDYIVVNYYKVIRLGFDEKELEKQYKLVYTEKAGGAELVHVYKRK